VVIRTRLGPLRQRWVAEHVDFVPGRQFRDVQREGPFARWVHTHRVEARDAHSAWLEDEIDYALPGGAAGRLLGGGFVRRRLARVFAYRHRVTRGDLRAHHGRPALRVAVTGASGLIGSALVPFLTAGGHAVVRVGRRPAPGGTWDPATGEVDAAALDGLDAFVHLAGEGIAEGRWTAARREAIRRSRVDATERLCRALAALPRPPGVFVCASAVGWYGDRGDEVLDEQGAGGTGFLAEVCRAWEEAAAPARAAGLRVVHLRLGVVLTPRGGMLARMLPPFRLGLGGRVGPGTQYVPWVAIDDVLGVVLHALHAPRLEGPVNVVAPRPATNRDLTRVLARVLRRPALLPLPAAAARAAFGGLADGLLLASQRVVPARLQAERYSFREPDLAGALRHLLGRAS